VRAIGAAARLRNGNTLITDEHDKLVREVNAKGGTVWEFKQADLPADVVLHNLQTAERLANGDTVVFSSTGGTKKEERPGIIQALEVTREKKLVWVLQDWKDLGPATTAQFLDQPGVPERPGDLQREGPVSSGVGVGLRIAGCTDMSRGLKPRRLCASNAGTKVPAYLRSGLLRHG